LEEAVAQLANSEELRSKLGNAARDSMQRYTWERAGKRLEELFRAIIEKQNISSPRDGRLLRKPPT
jgi:glycosyltransferase involved in cell wall biosynthesis